jgi:DNA helicase-2/ATP-dependent DNA helicase PcrA
MQNYDLNTLNNQQLDALYQTEGAVLVTAGAGSGKTRLLTHRIAYLVKEKKVSPYNIMAITFTNKAANEMLERTQTMLETSISPWISTFHSMCAKILRRHIDRLGYKSNFSIYSDSDADKLLEQILKEKNLQEQKKDLKKQVSFHISKCKNNNYSLEEYHLNNKTYDDIDKIMEVFYEYEKRLFAANALDFDDLLCKTYTLFLQHDDVLKQYSNRFHYVMVDEFQDTNAIQYELVKLLCSTHKNVFVVGDEDQCIYTWRGASYRNIGRFVRDFDAKLFKLEINYRSTPNILSLANKLIKNNTSRIEKNLTAIKQEGLEPEFYKGYSEQDEATYIASKIAFLTTEKGYNYNDFAILMRVNSLSLSFEQTLLSYNIPHRIFGGYKFFERAEIKLVISYLKLFTNPDDEVAFLRTINMPRRGLGDVAINKLKALAQSLGKSLIDTVLEIQQHDFAGAAKSKFFDFGQIYKTVKQNKESMNMAEFAKEVIEKFEIKSMYNTQIDEELFKVMNIDTFLANIDEFASKNPDMTLDDYLESITLMSDIDNMDESNVVTISTIHSVKGLEFKVIFVVGLEEGLFPIKRAFGSSSDMEEERRLMYVAITRAKERLYLTNTNSRYMYGKRDLSIESRFIKELGFERKLESKVSDVYARTDSSFDFNLSDFKAQTFGEDSEKAESKKEKKDISVYQAGQTVEHTRFGKGKILSVSGDEAQIKFDAVGMKTLILSLAPLTILN